MTKPGLESYSLFEQFAIEARQDMARKLCIAAMSCVMKKTPHQTEQVFKTAVVHADWLKVADHACQTTVAELQRLREADEREPTE